MNNKMKIITKAMMELVKKDAEESGPKVIEKIEQHLSPLETITSSEIWESIVMYAKKDFSVEDVYDRITKLYNEELTKTGNIPKQLFAKKSFYRKVSETLKNRYNKTKAKPSSRAYKEVKLVADKFKIKLPASANSPEKVSTTTEAPPPSQALKEPSAEQTSEQEQATPPTPQPPTAGQAAGPTSPRPLETDIPPMCERCNVPMVERTSKTKQKFWSCPNYLNKTISCRFTRNWGGSVGRKKVSDSNPK